MFFVASDRSLAYRTKTHLILAGPCGHVYARSNYYYASQYGNQPNGFEVAGYLAEMAYEPPQTGGSIPSGAATHAVSLVRIFHHPPNSRTSSGDSKLLRITCRSDIRHPETWLWPQANAMALSRFCHR
jgi:hypothetical protein